MCFQANDHILLHYEVAANCANWVCNDVTDKDQTALTVLKSQIYVILLYMYIPLSLIRNCGHAELLCLIKIVIKDLKMN